MWTDYSYYTHLGAGPGVVLDGQPSREGQEALEFRRRIVTVDPGPGARLTDAHDLAPSLGRRPFVWINFSRAETLDLLAFTDYAAGRLQPFWMPSYDHDLMLTANAAAGASAIIVQAIGYTTRLFPGTHARKHLAFMAPGGALSFAQVASAVDNGNGTETLTLEDLLTDALTAGVTMVCFLRYARLEEDELEIEFEGECSSCRFAVRELPREVPA